MHPNITDNIYMQKCVHSLFTSAYHTLSDERHLLFSSVLKVYDNIFMMILGGRTRSLHSSSNPMISDSYIASSSSYMKWHISNNITASLTRLLSLLQDV